MKNFLCLILFIIIFLPGCDLKKSNVKLTSFSLIGPCEKKIQLFEQKSKWVIEKKRAYIHFKYEDEYPSKKAFYNLEKQLLQCGWKFYEGDIEFLKGTSDWVNYLKGRPDNKTEIVHHFIKNYTDESKKRIASILLIYYSQEENIEELRNLCKPNNNKQYITVQIDRFDKKEYKKVMEEELKNKKSKENK